MHDENYPTLLPGCLPLRELRNRNVTLYLRCQISVFHAGCQMTVAIKYYCICQCNIYCALTLRTKKTILIPYTSRAVLINSRAHSAAFIPVMAFLKDHHITSTSASSPPSFFQYVGNKSLKQSRSPLTTRSLRPATVTRRFPSIT
jgi:hypothetical protein